jgi:hypothetical protein
LTTIKRQISIIAGLFILFSFSDLAYSQNTKLATATHAKRDSADLRALVVKLLKWAEADKIGDFKALQKNQKDTIFTGIDWNAHQERVAELEKTNFFTKGFIDNYQKIALHLDQELKKNKTKYAVGDLPPYGNDANEWCNCQDFPYNYLRYLKIADLKIKDSSATFKWTWGDKDFYSVKARKENDIWRIAELERFDIKNFSW